MSARAKTEGAFRQLLRETGVAGTDDTPQILLSHEEGQTVKAGEQRVNIRAISAGLVTPKTRNLRYLVLVSVETSADVGDPDADDPLDPVPDHAEFVDDVHAALDDNPDPLANRLSSTRATVGAFTCFGVLPQGEIDNEPEPEKRIFRDTWGYVVTVAESDST